MDARARAWQGAWAGDGAAIGLKAAWSIDGTKISYVDSGGAKTLTLEMRSPCTASFVEKSADGSTSGTVQTYTLQDGQLITGLGDAGTHHGAKAVVCGFGEVITRTPKLGQDQQGRLRETGVLRICDRDLTNHILDQGQV
jgi:hypothetical protein